MRTVPPLMKVVEVAAALKVGTETVYRLIRDEKLPCVRNGRFVMVERSAFEEWVAEHPVDNPFIGADPDMVEKHRCKTRRRDDRTGMCGPRTKLKALRMERGLTQTQAASLAGYSDKSGWAKVELGWYIPSAEQMRRMAAVLNGDPADLFVEYATQQALEAIGSDKVHQESAVRTLLELCADHGFLDEAVQRLTAS